jgi:hypothetical protein
MNSQGTWRQLLSLGGASLLGIGAAGGLPIQARAQDPQDLPRPVITSVSSIVPKGTQTIVIRGIGFGHAEPFSGKSSYFRLTDVTQRNWMAGWASFSTAAIPVIVSKWTETEMVIEGFQDYGWDGGGVKHAFEVGDVVKIEVANPKGPRLPGPNPDEHSESVGVFSVRVSAAATTAPTPAPGADGDTGVDTRVDAASCAGCMVSLSLAPSVVASGRTVMVYGVVQDESGSPASRAEVELTATVAGAAVPPTTITAHTDGTFGVPFKAPRSASVVTFRARLAGAPRSASVTATLKVAPN